MYGGSGEDSGWAELLSAAVGPPGAEQVRTTLTRRLQEFQDDLAPDAWRCCTQVSGVQFCQAHEVLWAGTESGSVYSLQFPLLERYASVRCATFLKQRALD